MEMIIFINKEEPLFLILNECAPYPLDSHHIESCDMRKQTFIPVSIS